MQTHFHTHTHTHPNTSAHTHNTQILHHSSHTRTDTHEHTQAQTQIDKDIDRHMHIYTNVCTFIHTYTHSLSRALARSRSQFLSSSPLPPPSHPLSLFHDLFLSSTHAYVPPTEGLEAKKLGKFCWYKLPRYFDQDTIQDCFPSQMEPQSKRNPKIS